MSLISDPNATGFQGLLKVHETDHGAANQGRLDVSLASREIEELWTVLTYTRWMNIWLHHQASCQDWRACNPERAGNQVGSRAVPRAAAPTSRIDSY